MCHKCDFDDFVQKASAESIREISLDFHKQLVYLVTSKKYQPFEVLLGAMKFVSHGILALAEGDEKLEATLCQGLFELVGRLKEKMAKEDQPGATWPDGTKVEL